MKNKQVFRILFSLSLVLAFSFYGQAQVQKGFGVAGGLNFAKVNASVDGFGLSLQSITAPQAGVFLRLPVQEKSFIQPEIAYVGRGYSLGVEDIFGGTSSRTEVDLQINYLDFGATYQARLGQNQVGFLLGAGPFISYALGGNAKGTETTNGVVTEIEEDIDFDDAGINRLDLTFVALAGLDIDLGGVSLILEGRYQLGVLNIASESEDDASLNHRGIGVRAGVVFPIAGN